MEDTKISIIRSDKIISTGKRVFKNLYRVRIKNKILHYMDENPDKTYLFTGDKEFDDEIMNGFTVVMITISQMSNFFKNDLNIDIINHKDVEHIYKTIQDYLEAWQEQLRFAINIGNAPIDDLIILDKMASKLYDHATVYHKKYDNSIAGLFGIKKEYNFSKNLGKDKVDNEVDPRRSMSDYFAGAVFGDGSLNNGNRK